MTDAPSYHTFHAGPLRCVAVPAQGVSGIFGVAIDAGSRDEDPERLFGLAHFVEHTIFKGTPRRSAARITTRMEAVGGELNAYTTKEATVVYSIFPKGNLRRAAELISDLVSNSTFPTTEIDRERRVIDDEISSYLDMPSEAVFDEYEDMMFHGSPLGHNILGTRQSVAGITSDDCRQWLHDNFCADRMVAFYIGSESRSQVEAVIRSCFADMRPQAKPRVRIPANDIVKEPYNIVRDDCGTHQAHTVMGATLEGISQAAENRYADALLTNIIGGPGMNSLLNMALRERRGLVYSVEASITRFTDVGLFTIYFGCDPEDRRRCVETVYRVIEKFISDPYTGRKLQAAKRQYLGQLALSTDNREQLILGAARSLLYRGEVTPADDVRRSIEAITTDQLHRASLRIAPSLLSTLTLS